MKKVVANVVTAVLVVCALLVTVAVTRREFMASSAPPALDRRSAGPRPVDDWQALATAGLWLGSPEAPVVVIEFADFQCPFCAVAAENLREVRSRYGDAVAVVFRHFPLEHIHPHTHSAAVAAECADAQDRFGAFHDLLFARQDEIGETPWTQFAAATAMDTVAFAACLEATWSRDRVSEDARVAREAGLTGTPSVIVGGLLLPGTPSVATLRAHIDEALEDREHVVAGGDPVAPPAAVFNRFRPWASGPWLDLDAERTMSTRTGFLTRLGVVAAGPSGRIYAVEHERDEILVFDATLGLVRALPASTFGRVVSAREATDDGIVVFDDDARTAVLWSGGAPGRLVGIPGFGSHDPYDVWKLGGAADFLVAYRRRSFSQDNLDDERSDVVGLARHGAPDVDSMLSFPSREMLVATSEGGGFSVESHPFGRRPYFRLMGDDRIVHALSDEFKITVVNVENGAESWFSHEIEAMPVQEDEMELAVSTRSESGAAVLRESAPYDRPILAGVAVDDERRLIWAGIRTHADFVEWAAFDLSGRHRASLLLPDGVEVVGAWRNRLFAIEYEKRPFDPVLKSYLLREPVPP